MAKQFLILLTFCSLLTIATYAQSPPPPPPGNAGSGGGPVGGGSPVGDGALMLIIMSAAWAGYRQYNAGKKQE